MKRFLSFSLTIVLILSMFSIIGTTAYAATDSSGDWEYYLNNGTVCITKCNLNSANITIPSTLDNKTVTAIDDNAFKGCTSPESIIVDENNASCYHIPLDRYILKTAYDFDSMQNRIKIRGKKNSEYRIIADEKEY